MTTGSVPRRRTIGDLSRLLRNRNEELEEKIRQLEATVKLYQGIAERLIEEKSHPPKLRQLKPRSPRPGTYTERAPAELPRECTII